MGGGGANFRVGREHGFFLEMKDEEGSDTPGVSKDLGQGPEVLETGSKQQKQRKGSLVIEGKSGRQDLANGVGGKHRRR